MNKVPLIDTPLPSGQLLEDGSELYSPISIPRKQLEADSIRLWQEVQQYQELLAHLPVDGEPRMVEPISADELDHLHEYLDRVAVNFSPDVDRFACKGVYKAILDNIATLAHDWTAPIRADPAHGTQLANTALSNGTVDGVRLWMLNVPDLSVLARYDTYGPLVIRAIMSRFLHLEIFSMGLAGIFPQPEGMFDNDFLTRPGVDPARSELERRRWHQLLYSGLIAHPTFANLRRNREQNLANDLNQLFSFLYPNESHYQRLLSEIIEPAMELKLRIANTVNEHKFLFFSTPIPMEITPEFLSQFGHLARESLTGKDVADPTKKIVFENTNQASIANGCLPICSISPIITYRDVDVDPADVDLTSRGKIVCVRGTPEERQAILDNIIPGPFYIIFSSPSGSQSGSQSGQATQ